MDCPHCGEEMVRARVRALSITLTGADSGGEVATDDGGADELRFECPECNYSESAEYRDGDEETED